jgi:hypothetical protein
MFSASISSTAHACVAVLVMSGNCPASPVVARHVIRQWIVALTGKRRPGAFFEVCV